MVRMGFNRKHYQAINLTRAAVKIVSGHWEITITIIQTPIGTCSIFPAVDQSLPTDIGKPEVMARALKVIASALTGQRLAVWQYILPSGSRTTYASFRNYSSSSSNVWHTHTLQASFVLSCPSSGF